MRKNKEEYISQKDIDINASKIFVKKQRSKNLILYFFAIILFLLLSLLFLFYGPWDGFRNLWITSTMKTKSHQYFARFFYQDQDIYKVLANNSVKEEEQISDPNLYDFAQNKTYLNKFEKALFKDRKEQDLFRLIKIQGNSYRGYLVAIYDPSKVSLALSKYLGKCGQTIKEIGEQKQATVLINASGYYDPGWTSKGEIAHGTVISNGKIVSDYEDPDVGGGFVGFNDEHKLILGKMTKEKALTIYRDAIEFGPFLIMNGMKSQVIGNGGWGIAPRTAIGQRKDGVVLFLVIDGRLTTSLGADMNDLIEIMYNYGAMNAANLDGGSSSALWIEKKIINHPVGNGKDGLRNMPTFWIVK